MRVLKPLVAALALVAVIALPGVASGAGVLDSGQWMIGRRAD
jgi:hypothetical protein